MIKKLAAVLMLVLCFGSVVKAETKTEVAERIVKDSLGDEQLKPIIDSIVGREVYLNPSIQPLKQVIVDFYNEVFTSDEFVKAVVKINTDLYTLEELLSLEKMMALPIHKTHQKKLPEYLTKINQLSIQVMLANQLKFRELILEAQKKLPKAVTPEPAQPEFSLKSVAYTDQTACPNYPYETLVGTWGGEREDSKTGTVHTWKNTRYPNGKMLIEFTDVSKDGVVDRFSEEGLWSYSGCLYTSIIQKIDDRDVFYQEVYRVHEVNDSMMRYSSFRVGEEFTVKKLK